VPSATGSEGEAFVREYFAQVPPEELAHRDQAGLAAEARSHLELAHRRQPGEALVRAFAPRRAVDGWDDGHTIVQIVNDDMPFLVDSVTMELERQGLGLHLIVHPILRVRRDEHGDLLDLVAPTDRSVVETAAGVSLESFVGVEVDRETDADRLQEIEAGLSRVLHDVRAATQDWLRMVSRLRETIDEAADRTLPIPDDMLAEELAFLRFLEDQHFTFLGTRSYDLRTENGGDVLYVVPGSGLGILRDAHPGASETFAKLPPEIRARAREHSLLVLTKANRRSTVHRPTYLDYVGVRRFDDEGNVIGEHRFLGLFTSSAYNSNPIDVPLLRRKVAAVVERARFLPASHDQKDLIAILETYPRDDLFQISIDRLFENAMGILRLQERRQVRIFVNREIYGRFVSIMVLLPRDRYTTPVRQQIAQILTEAFDARSHEWNVRLGESVLARLHFVLHVDPNRAMPDDLHELEQRIAMAVRAWVDEFRDVLASTRGEEASLDLLRAWGDAFPAAYRDAFDAHEAVADLAVLQDLDDNHPLAARLSPRDTEHADLKLYGCGSQPSLSDVLPSLTNMGVIVDDEQPYDIVPGGAQQQWIKHVRLRVPDDAIGPGSVGDLFEAAFLQVLRRRTEDDSFNRLVLFAGMSWREVTLLRAYSRYLRQVGTLYRQSYIADALATHAGIARSLVELFVARLDPYLDGQGDTDRLVDQLEAALDAVTTLDEDRILRSLMHLVLATLRTNWFQTTPEDDAPRSRIVVKLDPTRIPDAPLPRPLYEIFVYSPRLEAVHLRAGRVARGGIRWSDRREDFRTEILGLMKAQRVKNVVIVPSGAKGGFVVKRPPPGRDALGAEVEACYREFMSGLLDVTDNMVHGKAVPPPRVVRYDGDDTYLVVAADKGTATFSDIANEIATARGFWLGDAFASGGSTGYDHKAMGITARGAWVSVARHFRDLDVDVHTDEFTVVGVGDMSGDVFGNAMLLSPHIVLVAAFDHRHVFIDPHPDPASAFEERTRLFALPRSSWDEYDRSLLSPGGGVFPRTLKKIVVNDEIRGALGLPDDLAYVTPNEMISAILKAPVDLLFNGGIGTFVKSKHESHADVGDKANDAVRVDGADLRCRVVGEGGNLGFTQRGRVEYALRGGLINTDAIDNSAGVDLSDHEVNLKVLLDRVVQAGELTVVQRNELLHAMSEEVAAFVLRDNYRQTRALGSARAQAAEMEDVHARFIRALELAGDLDRTVEALPSDEELADRRATGLGLTAPELAVLLAYAKIALQDDVLASALPDDPDFLPVLREYFPPEIRDRYDTQIRDHPLRREIIVTALVNGMVNRAGSTFAFRIAEETGANADEIVRAHEAARCVFRQSELWARIEQLDGVVPTEVQTSMYLESRKMIERASRWFLRYRRRPLPVRTTIEALQAGIDRLNDALPGMLRGSERDWFDDESARLKAHGVPPDLAQHVATLDALHTALDITDLAAAKGRTVDDVAALFCVVGNRLAIDWLRDRAVDLPRDDRWQALSRRALLEDIDAEHRRITASIAAATDPGFEPGHAFDVWAASEQARVDRVVALLDEIRTHGVFDLATLSVALRELRSLG
jgi:glutamate dehydrogenase